MPSFSRGGILEELFSERKAFRTLHHCLEDRVPDFNLSESDCLYDFFESLTKAVTLLCNCLNVVQCLSSFVNLAARYALLRFHIYLLIK